MSYNEPLKTCVCGKKSKLEKNGPYRRYACSCGLVTFFSKNEETARELHNSQIENIDKLKVRI